MSQSWFERCTLWSGPNNDGVGPFGEHVGSIADIDVCAVGGDGIRDALWRAGPGRALEALGAAGSARETHVFLLVGLNDVLGRTGNGMGVVGGLCALARQDWDFLSINCINSNVQYSSYSLVD